MWWFTDHHIEKGAPARFLFLLSNVLLRVRVRVGVWVRVRVRVRVRVKP
jgi:hypothetical protein|tara:strand:+ start:239 stop:385 length:147 start_codon:yes stop_codon:yes gene_type:complete